MAFNTVRYSEKLLERSGISIETLDLSEALGRIATMKDDELEVKAKLETVMGYTSVKGVPTLSLKKMAKLGVGAPPHVRDGGAGPSPVTPP